MDEESFHFEDLGVWKKSVDFAVKVIKRVEAIQTDRRHYRLIEQLEACATSMASNIAEGRGRFSKKEFIQFLYIARGSLFETLTMMTIFKEMGWMNDAGVQEIRTQGSEISKMLSALIETQKSPVFKPGDVRRRRMRLRRKCGEDDPAECCKNIEEIFATSHDAGSSRKETPCLPRSGEARGDSFNAIKKSM